VNIHKKVHAIILSVVLLLSGTIVFFNANMAAPAQGQEQQQKIVFQRNPHPDGPGTYDIFTMNADGSEQTNLSNNPSSLGSRGFDEYPNWSPDGTKIVFYHHEEGGSLCGIHIFTMNADGTGRTDLSSGCVLDTYPDWSPDGTKIIFVRRTSIDSSFNRDDEIYVMNADGTGVTRLTNNRYVDTLPIWSPDGTKIAFLSNPSQSQPISDFAQLYVMNADGCEVTKISEVALDTRSGSGGISWSPDGTKIVYAHSGRIYTINADGTGVKQLIDTGGPKHPDWSPDGTKITFSAILMNAERYEIYVMNADGTGVTRVTSNDFLDWYPRFAPVTREVPSPPVVTFLAPLLTPAYAQSATCGDLSITSVSPVQAPDNPDFVIDGKPTIVKAKIKNTFTDAKTVDMKVTSPSVASGSYSDIATGITIASGEQEYYLKTPSFIIPSGSSFTATVEVDSGKILTESDETNNVTPMSTAIQIKKAQPLKIVFVPIVVRGDTSSGQPSCPDNVGAFANSVLPYIKATYPIKDVLKVVKCEAPGLNPFDRISTTSGHLSESEVQLISSRLDQLGHREDGSNNVVRVIGVVRDNWIKDLFFQGGASDTAKGVQYASDLSAIVEKGQIAGDLAAHEVAHSFGWVTQPPGDSEYHFTQNAPGYWVEKGLAQNTVDFMHAAGFGGSGDPATWVSKETFNYLLPKLTVPGDPSVIELSGYASQDGTAFLQPLVKFDDVLDIPLDNQGEYTISYTDSSGNILAQTGFDLPYYIYDIGPTTVDGFSLRIPDVAGTEKIVLKHGDQVLAESTFEGIAKVVEQRRAQDAVVTFEVNTTDNVDGNATLGTDGTTITQD
jgi:Tol biopolymer transport system component